MGRNAMQPPSMYTKEEFHNNVLPRAADHQPPRILNELRQLSCRLVASGIAKGLLKAEDLPEIRKTLITRFEVRPCVRVCVCPRAVSCVCVVLMLFPCFFILFAGKKRRIRRSLAAGHAWVLLVCRGVIWGAPRG